MKRWFALALVGIGAAGSAWLVTQRSPRVGDRSAGGVLVNTGQRIDPQGRAVTFGARPVDVVISDDGRVAYARENQGLTVVDTATGKILQRLAIPGGSGMSGLVLDGKSRRLFTSTAGSEIVEVDVSSAESKILRRLKLPNAKVGGAPYPCGLALGGGKLYAALNRSNQVVEIALDSGEVTRTFDVAVAPFGLAHDGGRLWVTSWGQQPAAGEESAPSSGSAVAVDGRGIGKGGVLQRLDVASGKVDRVIPAGLQPCEIGLAAGSVWVASAASDQVLTWDRRSERMRTLWKATVGAAPASLAPLPGGAWAVACGGSNEVVVLDSRGRVKSAYRSGWYPTAVRAFRDVLVIASAKGIGSRGLDLDAKAVSVESPRRGVYQFTGIVSIVPTSETQGVAPQALPASLPPRKDRPPVPIPERPGEPSVFKHVIYILKENRTYDQVFGDIGKGDSDPKLCIYGDAITPNHHALANEFALLDNYYCNGVLSADGHSWSTEGNATTYFERSFGGWTRSYPFGDDPLAISGTGHIWDAVLDKGLTFRNYGEYNYAEPANGEKYLDILRDFESGERKVKFKQNVGVARLRKHSHPECPGWNMSIPDVVRAGYFLRDLEAANRTGVLPDFNFVYLPQDHTSGGGAGSPHPTAHVADNDLALGRIVDAVSRSRFWKETVIFVIEDDPQDGFDHVDGHRSLCLVISPYTRRGSVVSTMYNQASVLKSIRLIFGIAPATRFEKIASAMGECFQATPDLRPYTARPNRVPLDRMNGDKVSFAPLDLSKPDLVDEDQFNRQLWQLARGRERYPAEFAGAHGRGLDAKGLRLDAVREDDD